MRTSLRFKSPKRKRKRSLQHPLLHLQPHQRRNLQSLPKKKTANLPQRILQVRLKSQETEKRSPKRKTPLQIPAPRVPLHLRLEMVPTEMLPRMIIVVAEVEVVVVIDVSGVEEAVVDVVATEIALTASLRMIAKRIPLTRTRNRESLARVVPVSSMSGT